ncbi:hypothetical protein QBC43DRAFT_220963 [Cladorrhinum sp. PSN259]|nr:hypothetical protein QBC43DRAFT_220963 [Cladorrhinum sp. PSN259]
MASTAETPRVRKDIESLGADELDTLIRAFKHIQDLPTHDPNSFFQIAGYHGMPFRGAGWGNQLWWGGYCNHGNILFPTWHRAYVHRLEEALRTAPFPGCADIAFPYWNELKTQQTAYVGTPPPIFLARSYAFQDGTQIPNPLYSYKLGKTIVDNTVPDTQAGNYTKGRGYETVRYPFSGLVGKHDKKSTEEHNESWAAKGQDFCDKTLTDNVFNWLNLETFDNDKKKPVDAGVGKKFEDCLKAPNYTVFSNTTSAKAWNDDHMDEQGFEVVVSVENPHNKIHLAVGGFEIPGGDQSFNVVAEGANGDMGENDTASFDPIFFFHHCWIDRVFWQWQTKRGATEKLDIKYARDVPPNFPGTNSVDSQGPTPGVAANIWLTLDSPLDPFVKEVEGEKVSLTSRDVTDINKLGYTYEGIHAEKPESGKFGKVHNKPKQQMQVLKVAGVNRAKIKGSFVVSTWARTPGEEEDRLVGVEAVLSRWNISGCSNCQAHLDAGSHVTLEGVSEENARATEYYSKLHTRHKPAGEEYKDMKFRVGDNLARA